MPTSRTSAYAGLTDGDQWVFYRVFDQKPLPERVVLEVSIANEDSSKAALKLLLLWRPNLASGQPIEPSKPITVVQPPDPPTSPAGPELGQPYAIRSHTWHKTNQAPLA